MKNTILTFIGLVFWANLLALKPDELSGISFTRLSTAEGLSDNNVECILKDSDGFVWFGTRNGLCRFDGYEFKVYKQNNHETSLSGNRILDIAEDNDGFMWIGTYKNGLNKLNKQTGQIIHYGSENGIGERINRIKKFRNGTVWICSNKGLAIYNPVADTFRVFVSESNNPQALHADLIHDVFETSSGDIFVASEFAGLQKLDLATGTFRDVFYARDAQLTTNYRKTIIEDKSGVLWISAHNHGLCSYNPKTGESQIFTSQNSPLSTDVLMGNMALDANGNLWLCTEEDGVNIFNIATRQFSYLRHNPNVQGSLSTNHTYSIYIDNEQLVWIGTYDKGVNIYNRYKDKFKPSLFSENDLKLLSEKSVLDVFEDSKHRVWVGTDGNGLYKFEEGKEPVHYYSGARGTAQLSSNIITSISEDATGNLLFGTYTGGLISYNVEQNRTKIFRPDYTKPNQLSSTNVWEIFRDSRNRIWLGLLGTGVDEYLPDVQLFNGYGPYSQAPEIIDFPNVMAITEDSDGDIWYGTEGKGIFILDFQTRKVLQIPNDTLYKVATEGIIKCMLQDRWGYFWIGTEDNGLFRYDKKEQQFTKLVIDETRPTDPVLSLCDDNMGNLWVGTNHGLYRYSFNTQKFNRFVTEDGLPSNDFNADAMVKLHDGRILAGTKYGVVLIEPDKIQLNQILPKILLTRLTVLYSEVLPNNPVGNRIITTKNITYLDELELNWKEKIFTIEFAAINYTLPQKCEYKYKLDGFDENWVKAPADRRMASYTNLAPGSYVFKVMASNNDGKWGNNEIQLAIRIKPPFWNTLLFKILWVVMFGMIIFTVYKVRINMHKERFRQQQLEQERKIMALEKEKLESELKKLAFSVINKNKMLVEQKTKILGLMSLAKVSVKEGLQKIVNSIDEDLDEEKDWKFIEPQIDKAYNQFISTIKAKHPDLTASEIRIAAYVRMNLSTMEICDFMNKTQRAVENDRYRLRKKIGLDANDNIQNYLMNL